jgi:hypothetical protein
VLRATAWQPANGWSRVADLVAGIVVTVTAVFTGSTETAVAVSVPLSRSSSGSASLVLASVSRSLRTRGTATGVYHHLSGARLLQKPVKSGGQVVD